MPRPGPYHIEQLSDKLLLLYAYSTIKSDVALADRLNIEPPTLSGYVNGDGDQLRGTVPLVRMRTLAEVLVEAGGGRISIQHAEALWLAPKDTFARALAGHPTSSFLQLIQQHPDRMKVSATVRDPRILGMVDGLDEIPEGAIPLLAHEAVSFACETRKGRCITVLYEHEYHGWFPAVPGRFHTGAVRSNLEQVPSARGFRFKEPYGLYRFVFLETETSEPIQPRLGGVGLGDLSGPELEVLQSVLTDRNQVRSWRWAEKFVVVSPPKAGTSPAVTP